MINVGTHFTSNKKLQIIRDYEDGKDITPDMERYFISPEELAVWIGAYKELGKNGLKVKYIPIARNMGSRI